MVIDIHVFDLVTDIVIYCDYEGKIHYVNATAHTKGLQHAVGSHITAFVPFDNTNKSERFLDAVRHATKETPTDTWELLIGNPEAYHIVALCGYCIENEHLIIIGYVQKEEMSLLHQEMTELTSELAEAQRETRRQNRTLQKMLQEQRQLVRIIMSLTAPVAPIWDGSLLLSLLGQNDTHNIAATIHEVWQRVGEPTAQYVLLDLSMLNQLTQEEAQRLIDAAHAIQQLHVQPLLIDAGSGAVAAIKRFAIDIHHIPVYSDVQQAIASVGSALAEQQETEAVAC